MKKLLYSVSTALLLPLLQHGRPVAGGRTGQGRERDHVRRQDLPETRTEIGVKDGNSYPVLWSSGDRIGIISPVETLFQNASATLNASDAGKNSGIFVLETETAVESSMDLIVYYPYSSYTTYGDGVFMRLFPWNSVRRARATPPTRENTPWPTTRPRSTPPPRPRASPPGVVLAAARRGVRPARDFEHGIRRLQTQRRVAVV